MRRSIVREGERTRRISKLDAFVRRTVNGGLQGDPKQFQNSLLLLRDVGVLGRGGTSSIPPHHRRRRDHCGLPQEPGSRQRRARLALLRRMSDAPSEEIGRRHMTSLRQSNDADRRLLLNAILRSDFYSFVRQSFRSSRPATPSCLTGISRPSPTRLIACAGRMQETDHQCAAAQLEVDLCLGGASGLPARS